MYTYLCLYHVAKSYVLNLTLYVSEHLLELPTAVSCSVHELWVIIVVATGACMYMILEVMFMAY